MTLPIRRTLAVLLSLIVPLAAIVGAQAEPFQSTLPHAILIDASTKTVLFERGADDSVVPASTAKLMAVELVLHFIQTGKIRRDQMMPISETAWRQGGAPSRGSTMFAKLNSEVSVEDLLKGVIIDSANDAAIALAEGISGSQGAFATAMTERARELGLSHLTFTDAWGDASPDQKVTTREMALLAGDIIENYPDDYRLFGEHDFTWNKIKQPNRNPLLFMDIGADGLKTGNIGDSGYSLVGSAIQNKQRLIVAIYGAPSAKVRSDEARKLLQWGFRTFENKRVFDAGATVGFARVYGGERREVPLVTTKPIDVLVARDGSEKLTARISYKGPLMAPIQSGQPLAELHLVRADKEILSVPLETAQAVAVGSLPKRALDAGLEYVGEMFRKYVSRT